ncbi:hypothetical protein [Utexia brackfieldae]
MDDTLLDTESFHNQAWRQTLSQ